MEKPDLRLPSRKSRWLVYPSQGLWHGLTIAMRLALIYALCQAGWSTVMFWLSPAVQVPRTLVELFVSASLSFIVFGLAYFAWSGMYGLVLGSALGLAAGLVRGAGVERISARRAFIWGVIAGGLPGAVLGAASWPLWTRFAVTTADYLMETLVYVLSMALLPALGAGWLCQRMFSQQATPEEST